MNANFDKYCDSMSLYLDYDAAKPTDCEEAARLVAAFFKAAEPKPMDPQKAAMLSTLMTGAFGHCGGCRGDGNADDTDSPPCWKPAIERGKPVYSCPHCGKNTESVVAGLYCQYSYCQYCGERVSGPVKFYNDFTNIRGEWMVKEPGAGNNG